ncbi:MAG: cytochrome c oxidase subunit II, partial [Bacteroidota bacterium]
NMQMKIVVETEEEYNAWLASQKVVKAPATEEKKEEAPADSTAAPATTEKKDSTGMAVKP